MGRTTGDTLWLTAVGLDGRGGRPVGTEPTRRRYELAGIDVLSDLPIGQLEPFASPAPVGEARRAPATTAAGETSLVYRGPAWVGGRLRRMESRRGREGYVLWVEDAGFFEVSGDGACVAWREAVEQTRSQEDLEAALLGPCVLLALALRGVWCLHAAAAGSERSAVALVGSSGSGKSTAAAALGSAAAGWRQVADDLLPVQADDAGAWALPCFPQPNLAADLQWRSPAPERVRLTAVYVLDPSGEEVELRTLPRPAAALALVGQTVAARLFDAELQARHLEACAELAERVPVHALRFPRRLSALPTLTAAIAG